MANEQINKLLRGEAPRPSEAEEEKPVDVAEIVGVLDATTAQLSTALDGVKAIRDDLAAKVEPSEEKAPPAGEEPPRA
jgi:hypothetical protein